MSDDLARTLREHWLTGVHCDHDAKTDVATCYCALWRSEPQPNVGEAVERWIEHVLAALSHPPLEQGWRPISEAPKDAPQIMLGRPGCKSWVGHWAEENYVGVGEPKWIGDDGHGCPEPTVWQPLPEPPEGAEEEK